MTGHGPTAPEAICGICRAVAPVQGVASGGSTFRHRGGQFDAIDLREFYMILLSSQRVRFNLGTDSLAQSNC